MQARESSANQKHAMDRQRREKQTQEKQQTHSKSDATAAKTQTGAQDRNHAIDAGRGIRATNQTQKTEKQKQEEREEHGTRLSLGAESKRARSKKRVQDADKENTGPRNERANVRSSRPWEQEKSGRERATQTHEHTVRHTSDKRTPDSSFNQLLNNMSVFIIMELKRWVAEEQAAIISSQRQTQYTDDEVQTLKLVREMRKTRIPILKRLTTKRVSPIEVAKRHLSRLSKSDRKKAIERSQSSYYDEDTEDETSDSSSSSDDSTKDPTYKEPESSQDTRRRQGTRNETNNNREIVIYEVREEQKPNDENGAIVVYGHKDGQWNENAQKKLAIEWKERAVQVYDVREKMEKWFKLIPSETDTIWCPACLKEFATGGGKGKGLIKKTARTKLRIHLMGTKVLKAVCGPLEDKYLHQTVM